MRLTTARYSLPIPRVGADDERATVTLPTSTTRSASSSATRARAPTVARSPRPRSRACARRPGSARARDEPRAARRTRSCSSATRPAAAATPSPGARSSTTWSSATNSGRRAPRGVHAAGAAGLDNVDPWRTSRLVPLAMTPMLDARDLYRFYHAGDEETLALRGVSLTRRARRARRSRRARPVRASRRCSPASPDSTSPTAASCTSRASRCLAARRRCGRVRARSIGVLFQSATCSAISTSRATSCRTGSGGRRGGRRRRAAMLDGVGLEARASAHPPQLSGGELARAGLAVALANDPPPAARGRADGRARLGDGQEIVSRSSGARGAGVRRRRRDAQSASGGGRAPHGAARRRAGRMVSAPAARRMPRGGALRHRPRAIVALRPTDCAFPQRRRYRGGRAVRLRQEHAHAPALGAPSAHRPGRSLAGAGGCAGPAPWSGCIVFQGPSSCPR